jgi:TRAP transporter TAXI family solute receptor
MNTFKRYACLFATLFAFAASAETVGIASGQQTGTNWPMAQDVVKVCSTDGREIRNIESDGSLDNLMKVYQDKRVQYGIVQVDALLYQQGVDPQMMKKVVTVFPFFSTEIHAIAKDGSPINSLQDLAGKRVVEGPEGSGTWVTVQMIKEITKIKWTPILASQKDGYEQVRNGQADAEFIVAGRPISMLKTAQGVKLLTINHPKLDEFGLYTKTLLTTGPDYPFHKKTVSSYKVDNALVTFAFKNQYQKEIGSLVTCIMHNIETMQRSDGFHPKWRDVDPSDIDRIKWPSHPAAVAAIKRSQR